MGSRNGTAWGPGDCVLVRQMLIPVVRKRSLRWKYFTLVCFRASHSVRSLPGAAPNCVSSDSRHSTSLKRLAPQGAAFFWRVLELARAGCGVPGVPPINTDRCQTGETPGTPPARAATIQRIDLDTLLALRHSIRLGDKVRFFLCRPDRTGARQRRL